MQKNALEKREEMFPSHISKKTKDVEKTLLRKGRKNAPKPNLKKVKGLFLIIFWLSQGLPWPIYEFKSSEINEEHVSYTFKK